MDDNVSFVKTEYGKAGVRILHVRRQDGHHHDIRELEVSTSLQLNSRNDYIKGDNSLVIPTDTQKNNVYILARKHGISVVEKFGIVLCNFYLERYDWVNSVKVHIENVAWKRIQKVYVTCCLKSCLGRSGIGLAALT
ncbi:UOX (predicted) [Pycnogonum litorale]